MTVRTQKRRTALCACSHPEETHGNDRCLVVDCACRHMLLAPRRNKYGASKATGPLGELYDSKAEREYAHYLEYSGLRWAWAPRFILQEQPAITYRPDFVVWYEDSGHYVVDVKGHAARDFSLRVRLWKARYPDVPLIVVKNGKEQRA